MSRRSGRRPPRCSPSPRTRPGSAPGRRARGCPRRQSSSPASRVVPPPWCPARSVRACYPSPPTTALLLPCPHDDLRGGARATHPGRPGPTLVTSYDLGSGERVELSVTTYANWVAKTASLLAEEHDLERGESLRVDLPTHWLGPVFLGAAWALGLVVTEEERPDAVVCGPGSLERWAAEAGRIPVLGPARCSLSECGSRTPSRQACTTWGSTCGRSRTPSRRGTRPGTRTGPPTGLTQADLWEPGRRRGLSPRRRPAPLHGEPGFPFPVSPLSRGRERRFPRAGLGPPRRPAASRGGVVVDLRRGAVHRTVRRLTVPGPAVSRPGRSP